MKFKYNNRGQKVEAVLTEQEIMKLRIENIKRCKEYERSKEHLETFGRVTGEDEEGC